jgi:hypothetical protein
MKKEVFCTLQFDAVHNWPGCPIEEVAYLRDPHRHMFHVKAYKAVNHDDRDVEFIWLKHRISEFIQEEYKADTAYGPSTLNLGATSCEMLAVKLIEKFELSRCEVNEDDENGAIVVA